MATKELPTTENVSEDELTLGLVEINKDVAGAPHRFQIITVVRQDKPAIWQYDLGLSLQYHAHEFSIPAGQIWPNGVIEAWHTVGELREMAEQLRESKKDDPFPDFPTRNWEEGLQDEADIRKRAAEKVSIFGPKFSKMRY